ncbi:MAG: transglutaminase-like domain-containing protein [Nanoarchaeota archaeon]|nr:transglutaminase-like domain-containing protein [Nanoarchaeota archaeon]
MIKKRYLLLVILIFLVIFVVGCERCDLICNDEKTISEESYYSCNDKQKVYTYSEEYELLDKDNCQCIKKSDQKYRYEDVECCSDDDCPSIKECVNNYCTEVPCSCGRVENHQCIEYECCSNSDCGANEYCSNHNCRTLSCGSCEYVSNHQCVEYECCNDEDCTEGQCVNHICEDVPVATDIEYRFDPFKINCPSDCKLIDGAYIPKVQNSVASENTDTFLSHSIVIWETNYKDWWNYAPMVNKVNELIVGASSDLEKAERIISYVLTSRNYCTQDLQNQGVCNSKTNDQESYSNIFDSQYGVCFDGSFMAASMLRRAGIPAIYAIQDINHVGIIFFADGNWYATDPTPCFDRNNCPLRTITKIKTNEDRILYYHDYNAKFLDSSSNKYCDMSGLCYDVGISAYKNKLMVFSNNMAELFIPVKMVFNRKTASTQYTCSFGIGEYYCNAFRGCVYQDSEVSSGQNVNKWEYLVNGVSYLNGNNEIIYGYNYLRIPANKYYRFKCYEWFEGHPDAKLISRNYVKPVSNTLTIISPETLQKADGADQSMFNELKELMEESIEGINLNEIISNNPE